MGRKPVRSSRWPASAGGEALPPDPRGPSGGSPQDKGKPRALSWCLQPSLPAPAQVLSICGFKKSGHRGQRPPATQRLLASNQQAQQGLALTSELLPLPTVVLAEKTFLGHPSSPSFLWPAGIGQGQHRSARFSTPHSNPHLLSQRKSSGYDWVRLQGFWSQMASSIPKASQYIQGRKIMGREGGHWPSRSRHHPWGKVSLSI